MKTQTEINEIILFFNGWKSPMLKAQGISEKVWNHFLFSVLSSYEAERAMRDSDTTICAEVIKVAYTEALTSYDYASRQAFKELLVQLGIEQAMMPTEERPPYSLLEKTISWTYVNWRFYRMLCPDSVKYAVDKNNLTVPCFYEDAPSRFVWASITKAKVRKAIEGFEEFEIGSYLSVCVTGQSKVRAILLKAHQGDIIRTYWESKDDMFGDSVFNLNRCLTWKREKK